MRSSAFLSVLLAVGALSSPLLKRDIVEDLTIVTITKYVQAGETVDAGSPSTSTSTTASVAVDAVGDGREYGYGHRKGQGHRHAKSSDSATTSTPTTSDASTSTPTSTGSSTTPVVAQDSPSSTSSTTTSTSSSATSTAPASTSATSPASSPAAAPAGYGDDYQSKVINSHNLHRANHSASALTWSSELAATAAKHASTCFYGHDTAVNGGGYGQNIAAGTTPDKVHSIITNQMYNDEFDLYGNNWENDNPSGYFEGYGHLTQILWKATTEVGCATQKCAVLTDDKGDMAKRSIPPYFTVCNYKSPGNVDGQYHNVGKPLGHAYSHVE